MLAENQLQEHFTEEIIIWKHLECEIAYCTCVPALSTAALVSQQQRGMPIQHEVN